MTDLAPPTSAAVSPASDPSRSWAPRRPWSSAAIVVGTWSVCMLGTPSSSLGVAIALTITVTVTGWSFAPSVDGWRIVVVGAAFVPWFAVRQSPWLLWVNAAVAVTLLLVGLIRRDVSSVSVSPTLEPGAVPTPALDSGRALTGPEILLRSATHRASESRRLRSTAKLLPSLLLALGITAVVILLLATGDAVFASYLDLPGLGGLATRAWAGLLGLATFVIISVPAAALRRRQSGSSSRKAGGRWVRPTNLNLTMSGLLIGLIAYLGVQISAVVLGEQYVMSRSGLTYADWARAGFFQLVAVAGLVVAVLSASLVRHPQPSCSQRRLPPLLSLTVAALVVTAVIKLTVYADRFGLTMLRLYTVLFAIWVGVVAVTVGAACATGRSRLVAPTIAGTLLVGAFGLNVANPEAIVAGVNLDRAIAQNEDRQPDLDLTYLSLLSDDAAPIILSRADRLDESERVLLTAHWCRGETRTSWREWNASASAARAARIEHCG